MDINITKDDFDLTEELEIFNKNSSDHGAVSIFIGKVRPEEWPTEYARLIATQKWLKKKSKIWQKLRARNGLLITLGVLHRYGSLKPNDNIVLVITGSSHRSDSMSANQFIMDFLKKFSTILEKEIYPDKEIWVEQKESDLRKLYK